MALEQKLSLKLAQKLVMTPSLQQAIKLLQMTRMELDTLLTQELVENPVLEESGDVVEEEAATATEEERKDKEEVNGEQLDHAESMENIDLDAYFGDYWEGSGSSSMMEERDEPPIENSLTREPDLYDHLLWQLHMADEVTPRQREIAELIIGNLNPDGFLVATAEEIRAMGDPTDPDDPDQEGRDYTLEEVQDALCLVRKLDPPGIACADLQESLLQQMDAQGIAGDALARRILQDTWDLFLRRQFPAVAKKLGVGARRARGSARADQDARNPAGPQVQHRPAALHRARRVRPASRRRVRHPAQRRRPAAAARQPRLPPHAPDHAHRRPAVGGPAVHQGQDPLRGVADQEPRPAPAHDLQGRRLDRPPAARVPRPGHRVPAADGPARRRRGHRHARVDGEPRGLQQVHPHASAACSP